MKIPGALAIAVCTATALAAHISAQQLTITPADKAAYEQFLQRCSPQIAEMKRVLATHGESFTEQQFRDYFEPIPAQMRDMAQTEGMTVAEVLREGMSRTRDAMNDPASTDPSDKVVGPTMICFFEMLIAGEAASPAPRGAPRPAVRAAAPGVDAKLAAFRTLCADEGRKVGAARGQDYLTPYPNGMASMDEFFTQFADAGNRADAKAEFHQAMAADSSAFHRANMGLAACTIYFHEASAIGIPLSVMQRQWGDERVEVYALDDYPADVAPPPAPAPRPAPERVPPPAPAPAPVSNPQTVANSGGCLTIDWRGGAQGDPAILSNGCGYAINVGVCVRDAPSGSPSENVSCEQGRFISYLIGPRRTATVPATHGTVQTRVCTPPQMPAMWWENGTSVGNCR